MTQYKITAKRKEDCDPLHDQKGNLIWDGKSRLIVLTTGDEYVTKHMFNSMKTYTDSTIWELKLVKA